jgi:hypothetical protein
VDLAEAADALSMALLALDGADGDGASSLRERVAHVRALLVEAVTALGRARVHLPGVRTYAAPVVAGTGLRSRDELRRQHQLATQLLWFNYEYLPRKPHANPLSDEEERQLARVIDDLKDQSRLPRLGYAAGGAALTAGAFALSGLLGPGALVGVAIVAGALCLWHGLRTRSAGRATAT